MSNGVPAPINTGLTPLLNPYDPNPALQPGQISGGSPLLDVRPPKPRLINSASGGLALDGTWQGRQYTTDEFAPTPPYNAFIGNPQAARVRAFCVVKAGGIDITNKLMPYLISLRIIQRPLLSAEIEIDDRDARLPIPPVGTYIEIQLGWINERSGLLFRGKTMDLEYSDARQGGRHMTVHAFGIDFTNAIKQPGHDNLGEGAPPGQNDGITHTLAEWIQKEAALAGVTVDYMSPLAVKFNRDHWDRNGESLMQLVSRECERHGLFPYWHDGNQLAIISFHDSNLTIVAQVGNNLISLRVRPYVARGVYNADEQHYYDTISGQWKRIKVGNNFDPQVDAATGAVGNALHPAPAASKIEAEDDANGGAELAGTKTGQGRICINGEPSARYGCIVQVMGVRPGVDGNYRALDAVEHIYSRQGYITWLDVLTDPYAPASSNVLQGFFAEQIAALPPTFGVQPTAGTQTVPTPPLPLPELLDPGVNPSTSVNSITSLPPEAGAISLDALGTLGSEPIGGSL